MIEQADEWMRSQTIREPAHMTSVYAPGSVPIRGVNPMTTREDPDSRDRHG